ncbi:MAG: hypothetical protein L7V86_12640 [Verrucomicrobiales bacterium]|jgi:hypothetical protein|nr:hypothetical protein [Verrucomicrobiales bacterium]MDB2346431.1 hypothetical protein [Verrucomicrobiales bacterium]MDF1785421.1 hypothetical protein [Verrucomicrobiales bacterium]
MNSLRSSVLAAACLGFFCQCASTQTAATAAPAAPVGPVVTGDNAVKALDVTYKVFSIANMARVLGGS